MKALRRAGAELRWEESVEERSVMCERHREVFTRSSSSHDVVERNASACVGKQPIMVATASTEHSYWLALAFVAWNSCGFRLRNARNASDCVWMWTGLKVWCISRLSFVKPRDFDLWPLNDKMSYLVLRGTGRPNMNLPWPSTIELIAPTSILDE